MKSSILLIAALLIILVILVKTTLPVVGKVDTQSADVSVSMVGDGDSGKGVADTFVSMTVQKIIEKYIDYLGVGPYLRNIKEASTYKMPVKILDLKDGDRGLARCGYMVKAFVAKSKAPSSKDLKEIVPSEFLHDGSNMEFRLDETLSNDLRAGIFGMKIGSERLILSQEKDDSGDSVLYYVKLLPGMPLSQLKLDRLIKLDDGLHPKGKIVLCGDNVNIRYVLKNAKGDVVKGGRVSFTVGNMSVPPAIDHGVIGMSIPGKRIVIAPPDLIHSEDSRFPSSKSEISIIELYP